MKCWIICNWELKGEQIYIGEGNSNLFLSLFISFMGLLIFSIIYNKIIRRIQKIMKKWKKLFKTFHQESQFYIIMIMLFGGIQDY
jgi:uncharacterized membrane protein